MKKILFTILVCLVSVVSFGQLNLNTESRKAVASNSFGDGIYQFTDGVYLSLEFWEDNGLNKKFHPSVGYKYIKLGDDLSQATTSLNQLMDLMDSKSNDILTIYTRDEEELSINRDVQGGLEFRFNSQNLPYYSVIYKFRIKSLLKKL